MKRRERKKDIFNEITAENFPNLVRQIYRFKKQRESQTEKNSKKSTLKHIIVKLL